MKILYIPLTVSLLALAACDAPEPPKDEVVLVPDDDCVNEDGSLC